MVEEKCLAAKRKIAQFRAEAEALLDIEGEGDFVSGTQN
jgi:hypothetical protein